MMPHLMKMIIFCFMGQNWVGGMLAVRMGILHTGNILMIQKISIG